MPKTNQGSIGRTLRGIKYISSYLKSYGRSDLTFDFNQLKIKTGSVKMIPPYSKDEITKILEAVDRATSEGLRDYAILLLGFGTGLRGADIRTLCLSDIDWKVGKVKIRQCKTSEPLVLPLSGRVMNAIAGVPLGIISQLLGHKRIDEESLRKMKILFSRIMLHLNM